MPSLPSQFTGVTVAAKANVYFDGKVVSHSVLFPDGTKKTLGLIYPGSFHFGTGAPERMEIVAGACRVTLDGQREVRAHAAGRPLGSGASLVAGAPPAWPLRGGRGRDRPAQGAAENALT